MAAEVMMRVAPGADPAPSGTLTTRTKSGSVAARHAFPLGVAAQVSGSSKQDEADADCPAQKDAQFAVVVHSLKGEDVATTTGPHSRVPSSSVRRRIRAPHIVTDRR
jgi:hypothetical protein